MTSRILWRFVRWAIFARTMMAAKRVLTNHNLVRKDQQTIRWLKPDIRRFGQNTLAEAKRIYPNAGLSELPTVGSRLVVELAVFTVAGYRALRQDGIDPVSARQAIADTGWDVYRQMLASAALPAKIMTRNPARRLVWTIRILLWFPFNGGKKPGYVVKVKSDKTRIETFFLHCPPQTFVRRIAEIENDTEILDAFYESWCRYDWPGADLIAGDGLRGHYDRPHTLSRGDGVCDMCWHGSACVETAAAQE